MASFSSGFSNGFDIGASIVVVYFVEAQGFFISGAKASQVVV